MSDSTYIPLEIRANLQSTYDDVFTPAALGALDALAHFDDDCKQVMAGRIERRAARARERKRIAFLEPGRRIPRTQITAQEARDGRFIRSEVPRDLERQWIQGTGPAARPNTPIEVSIRNIAYALLSGADGWMFDGEYTLGQV